MPLAPNPTPRTLDAPIARVWQADAAAHFALSQATHALSLLAALFAARGKPQFHAWFPAYYCENGLPPLRRSGAILKFYPVTEAIEPDWKACEAMLADSVPDLFVVPHFFGVENDAANARAFCDRTGALLLEDAAHVLQPVGTIGRYGDLVCYSPRKYFDLPDAGILVVRSAALAAEIATASESLPHVPHSPWPWIGRRVRRVLLPRRRRSPMPARTLDDDPPSLPALSSIWMSSMSRSGLNRAGDAGVRAVAEREAKVAAAFDAIARRYGLSVLGRHPDSTPYLVGYRASSTAQAERALAELRRAGAMVSTWPGMPPEVKANPEHYGAAMNIRRTVLRFTPRRVFDRHPLDFVKKLPPPR